MEQIPLQDLIYWLIDSLTTLLVILLSVSSKFAWKKIKEIYETTQASKEYMKEDCKDALNYHYHKAARQGYITCKDLDVCTKKYAVYKNKLNGNSWADERMKQLEQFKPKEI